MLYQGINQRRRCPEGRCARVAASPRARIVYPRIDPAVIALVHCGDYALLGRQSRWAPGRYSCLAGESTLHSSHHSGDPERRNALSSAMVSALQDCTSHLCQMAKEGQCCGVLLPAPCKAGLNAC